MPAGGRPSAVNTTRSLGSGRTLDLVSFFSPCGPRVAYYAVSRVHMSDDSLEIMSGLAGQADPGGRKWAVDLGTGVGFNAFSLAQLAFQTVAADPARPMLREARRIGGERGTTNLTICQNSAEALPFAGESLDIVASRKAAHHFVDYGGFLNEAYRVLKPGGVLLIADSVAPEDGCVADWMEDVELRRDFSHIKNHKVFEIRALVKDAGLDLVDQVHTCIHLQFNSWVARTAIPESEAESLRRDFLIAPSKVKEAFEIREVAGDIHFVWPSLVFRALKV